jgi:broad specificity phosphatase PhoE
MDNAQFKMRIFLIRHGLSEANAAHPEILDVRDPELAPQGFEQAQKTGEALCEITFEKIITSPLLRALQTCYEITERVKTDVEIRAELCETFFSSREPLTIDEMHERFPKWDTEKLEYNKNGDWWTHKQDSDWDDIKKRAEQICSYIQNISCTQESNFGVIFHGGIGSVIIDTFLRIPVLEGVRYRLNNCSISIIEITENSPILAQLNNTSHLQ